MSVFSLSSASCSFHEYQFKMLLLLYFIPLFCSSSASPSEIYMGQWNFLKFAVRSQNAISTCLCRSEDMLWILPFFHTHHPPGKLNIQEIRVSCSAGNFRCLTLLYLHQAAKSPSEYFSWWYFHHEVGGYKFVCAEISVWGFYWPVPNHYSFALSMELNSKS